MAGRLNRGEIWLYTFKKPDKTRPVLVLSRSEALEFLHTVTVAPIRSTIRRIRTEILVGEDEGLKHPSAVSLDHLVTVEQAGLRQFVGTVSRAKLRQICAAAHVALGCDEN